MSDNFAFLYSNVRADWHGQVEPRGFGGFYLRDVLGRIAEHPINRINNLLPRHVTGGAVPSFVANA